MDLEPTFAALSTVIERYESRGRSVRDVEARTADGEDPRLEATVELPVALCSNSQGRLHAALSTEAATLTEEGRLELTVDASSLADPPAVSGASVTVVDRGVRVADGDLVMSVDLAIEPAAATDATDGEGPSIEVDDEPTAATDRTGATGSESVRPPAGTDRSTAAGSDGDDATDGSDSGDTGDDPNAGLEARLAAVRDESVPPYEDTRYLRRLFESCDTFVEMSEHIEMDVSPETVRRYMIEAGIHDPMSYDTAAEEVDSAGTATAADEPPTADESGTAEDPTESIPDEHVLADGIGLPADLTLADVADAVVDSSTVYEVAQGLDLEQQRTRDLLRRLGLLDLVMRRLGDDPERPVPYEEVAARIRQCAPDGVEAGT